MAVIGIITEYNPFHNGHQYQIDAIRRLHPDCTIVTVMSGNLVQRGEPAFLSKELRAKFAVKCGVDLVLELPSVYSSASAEIFASSAVHIFNKLGNIDYLYFGSECGDIDRLFQAAEDIRKWNIRGNAPYSNSHASGIRQTFTQYADILNGSNNILALEYIKALTRTDSDIIPKTMRRQGDMNYSQSATYIRRTKDSSELEKYVPPVIFNELREYIGNDGTADIKNIETAVISQLKRLTCEELAQSPDITGGFEYRIKEALVKTYTLDELTEKLHVKHYSKSRIQRIITRLFFGIKAEDIKNMPQFTIFLGGNKKGLEFLSQIRKTAGIKIITKATEAICREVTKNYFIDDLYKLAVKNRRFILENEKKPFILKN